MTFDISPLSEPRFCHQCGGPMRLQRVAEEDRERLVCQSCGFIHYMNPRVVASVVPELEGPDGARRVLLMRRAFEPRRGFWTPPGGFVELGESTEEAAVREALEEVGVPVEPFALLGVYSRPTIGIVVVAYRAHALAEEPRPGIEALEARWFTPDTIPWDDLAYETTTLALRDWLAAIEG
jgi:ADP-ribose pyrophosphatase YjhB (NUDIX family)